jgi:hypothetical protein
LAESIVGLDVKSRSTHRRDCVGSPDVDFIPRPHELTGYVNENGAGVEFDSRSCAAARERLLSDLEAAQLLNRNRGFTVEEDARERLFPGIDNVADNDTIADSKLSRNRQRWAGKLCLTSHARHYSRSLLLGVENGWHEQDGYRSFAHGTESRRESLH